MATDNNNNNYEICPICGKHGYKIRYEYDDEFNMLFVDYECSECTTKWTSTFKTTFTGKENIEENK